MLKTEMKEVTKTEMERVNRYCCDICGQEIDSNGMGLNEDDSYKEDVTKLYFKTGTNYGLDGHFYNGKKVDLCIKCISEKVTPLLEEKFKFKAREIEDDDGEYV